MQPIGAGPSIRDEIERAVAILHESGFETYTHAMSTEIEGELPDILEAVARIHEALHRDGTPRVTTSLAIYTRADDDVSIRRSRMVTIGADPPTAYRLLPPKA